MLRLRRYRDQRTRTVRAICESPLESENGECALALKRGAARTEIGLRQAELLQEMGKLTAALEKYDELLRAQGAALDPAVVIGQAAVTAAMGDVEPARVTLTEATRKWPDNGYGFLQLGLIELASGDPSAARDHLRQALDLGQKYRSSRALLEIGFQTAGGELADRRAYFAPGVPFLPTAIETIIYGYIACVNTGARDCQSDVRQQWDALSLDLRPVGAMGSRKLTVWPAPIIDYLQAQKTQNDLRAEAGEIVTRKCSAELAAAAHSRQRENSAEEKLYLKNASAICMGLKKLIVDKFLNE